MQSTERIEVLELLRLVAALLVVLIHMPTLRFQYGGLGVDLFFIISGYVMMLSSSKNSEKFFLRRVIRIVPVYWFFTILLFTIAIFFPQVLKATTSNVIHLVKSLFFIPFDKNGTGHFPILPVGWTLNFEMFFYAIFAFSMMCLHSHRDIITAMILCSCVIIIPLFATDFPIIVYSNPMLLEFCLGMLAFRILHTEGEGRWLPCILHFSILSLTCLALQSHGFIILGKGVLIFLVFLSVLYFSSSVKVGRIPILLGGASYSLYLSHVYILEGLRLTWIHFIGDTIGFGYTAVALLGALLASVISFKLIEQPMLRVGRRLIGVAAT